MHLNGLPVRRCKIALVAEFGDGIGNGIVQTAVERPKLVYEKRRIALIGEISYGLAQVAIIVHNLVDAVAEGQQLAIVLGGGRPPIRRRSCSVEGAGKDGTRQWFGRLIKAERLNRLRKYLTPKSPKRSAQTLLVKTPQL